jgi:hypothetical protein
MRSDKNAATLALYDSAMKVVTVVHDSILGLLQVLIATERIQYNKTFSKLYSKFGKEQQKYYHKLQCSAYVEEGQEKPRVEP